MSFQTLEVELDHGRVRPTTADTLPDKARALLTILSPTATEPGGGQGPSVADLAGSESLADRVAHLKGIGRGEYTDLSTNRRHMDDFGK